MLRSSIAKIAVIGIVVGILAGAGVYWYKRAEPKEIVPEVTISEIETAGLVADPVEIPRTGFEFHPPSGWEIDTSGSLGAYAVFINPLADAAENTEFNANITVTHESGVNYLEDFARKTRAALPGILSDYVQLDNRRVQLGETEGHLIGGTFTSDGISLRTLRLLIYENGTGYAVTAITLASAWDKYADQIDTAFRTFGKSNP